MAWYKIYSCHALFKSLLKCHNTLDWIGGGGQEREIHPVSRPWSTARAQWIALGFGPHIYNSYLAHLCSADTSKVGGIYTAEKQLAKKLQFHLPPTKREIGARVGPVPSCPSRLNNPLQKNNSWTSRESSPVAGPAWSTAPKEPHPSAQEVSSTKGSPAQGPPEQQLSVPSAAEDPSWGRRLIPCPRSGTSNGKEPAQPENWICFFFFLHKMEIA